MRYVFATALAAGSLMAAMATAQTIGPGQGATAPGATETRTAAERPPASDMKDVNRDDWEFAIRAAEAGHKEVALGKVASSRAENEEVKAFAERMVEDHTKVNQELMAIAERKGIALPDESRQQVAAAELEQQSGTVLDRVFMTQMVHDHEASVGLFEEQVRDGEDSELKMFAAKHLPLLREHLKRAQQIRQQFAS